MTDELTDEIDICVPEVNVEIVEDVVPQIIVTIQDVVEADHTKLSNRDVADQHPISAITGLQTALDAKQPNLTSANAGTGISITGSGSSVVISNTQTSAEWGNITGTLSNQTDLQEALDAKVTANNSITAGTHTKITYDTKGLVTAGSDLTESDIPSLHLTKISDVTATAAEVNYLDGVTSGVQAQINSKLNTSDVINNTTTTSTTQALSANMGKELQDEINNLKSRGRYLSVWLCTTGLPETNPTTLPYTYKTGDYFIVGAVAGTGGTNYKPNGATYTGIASTTVDTSDVSVNDTYYYDGTSWDLLHGSGPVSVTFSSIGGQPTDNANLAAALNAKVDANNSITAATKCKITYDSKGLVTSGTDLTASDIPDLTLSKITDVTASASEVNVLDGITASTAELNVLDGITASTSELNVLDGITASTSELNTLDGITATTTELNYVDGVTSNVQTQLDAKQATLVSGTNIKTINGTSVLGSGDITVGGSVSIDDTTITKNASDQLQAVKLVGLTSSTAELNYNSGVTSNIQTQLNGKQDTLVSGTNIKTINGTSVLGSGDITISGGGSLSDIANAGTNVEFTAALDNISSSDKISSPTISTEGLYVGNTSSYLSITDNSIPNYSADALRNTSFSWIVKLSISDVSTNKTLFSIGDSTYAVQVALSSGKLKGYYRTESSGGTTTITGTTELSNDTYYYIKVSKSSNVYSLSTSTDGETWTTEGSYSTINTFYTTCDAILSLRYAGVTYDLNGVSFETSLSIVDSWVAFSYNGKPFISSTIPSDYLKNKATDSTSVSIIGTGNSNPSGVNIGYGSSIGGSLQSQGSVAIGRSTKVTGGGFGTAMGYQARAYTYAIGIGYVAKATAIGAIQLGYGTNSTAGTFSVGLSATGSNWQNYQLLDSTGIIPVARIPDLTLSKISDITATATELNYCDGVTSAIQTQLDGKVSDVQVSGISVVTSGVANIPTASDNVSGVVKTSEDMAIQGSNGVLYSLEKTYAQYGSASSMMFVSKGTLENVITGKGLATIDDSSTTSTTASWSASKLNTTIGNIETLILAL